MLFDEYLSEANIMRFIPATGIGTDGSWYNVADIQIRIESVGAYQQMINGQQFAGITHYGFIPIEYDGSVFPNDMISVYKNLVYVYDDVWAITLRSLTGMNVLGGIRTTTPFILYKDVKNTIACNITLVSGSQYAFVGKDNSNTYHVLYSGISSGALINVEFSYLLNVPITEIGIVWDSTTLAEISNFRHSKVKQYKIVGEPITYEDMFPHIEVNLSKMQYEV